MRNCYDEQPDGDLHGECAAEIRRLQAELEIEHVRLAACGVIALSNTPESAAKARQCKPEYWSASAEEVAKVVDSEMQLRQQVFNLQAELEATQKACEVALSRQDEADQLYLQALAAIEAKDVALVTCKTGVCHDPRDFDDKPGDGAQWFNKELVANALTIKPDRAALLRHEARNLLEEATTWDGGGQGFSGDDVSELLKVVADEKLAAAEALEGGA